MSKESIEERRYTLDNSAKIWPALLSRRYTTWFRLFAVLKEPVHYEAMQIALTQAFARHPYFSVCLKPGVFWYHLAPLKKPVLLEADLRPPCSTFEGSRRTGPLVRAYAYNRTISVEASHMVTDGTGLCSFFTTLLKNYETILENEPSSLADQPQGLPHTVIVNPEEWQDSYLTHGILDPPEKRTAPLPKPTVPSKALHFPLKLLPPGQYRVSIVRYNGDEIREKAQGYGISVGEYLESLVMMGFQRAAREAVHWKHRLPGRNRLARPIRFLIPVDLRKLYGSQTMRNFFIGLPVEIDPRLGEFTLEEIIRRVHHAQRAELDPKYLRKQLSRNARGQQSLTIRLVPLAIKDLILSMIYRSVGDPRYTASFSNLGRFSADLNQVEWMGFLPPPSPINPINITSITFGNELTLGFGKLTRVGRIEHHVLRVFSEQGHSGRLNSNFERSTPWG